MRRRLLKNAGHRQALKALCRITRSAGQGPRSRADCSRWINGGGLRESEGFVQPSDLVPQLLVRRCSGNPHTAKVKPPEYKRSPRDKRHGHYHFAGFFFTRSGKSNMATQYKWWQPVQTHLKYELGVFTYSCLLD